jgi:hypothetical protein
MNEELLKKIQDAATNAVWDTLKYYLGTEIELRFENESGYEKLKDAIEAASK